jgi:tetratricopeptide (TPR) repeat protein
VLDWLIAGGILGLLAYLSLYFSAIYLLWKKSSDMTFVEKSLFTGLGAAYFFHNLFVFDNIMSSILFTSVLAFIHFKSTRLEKSVGGEKDEMDNSDTRVAGPIILILLIGAIYFLNWRGIQTGKTLIVALQAINSTPIPAQIALDNFQKALSYDTLGRPELVERMVEAIPRFADPSIPIEIKQKYYELTKGAVEKQLQRFPGDTRYEIFAGNFYSMYTQPADAEKHYMEAVKLSPRKQSAWFQLGAFYTTYKQYDKAVEAYKTAYELETSNLNAAQLYAAALTYAGREAEATKFLQDRFGKTVDSRDLFLQVYANQGDWARAISLLKQKVAENPSSRDDRMNLISAYYQSGDKASAIKALKEYIAIEPGFKGEGELYIKQIEEGK